MRGLKVIKDLRKIANTGDYFDKAHNLCFLGDNSKVKKFSQFVIKSRLEVQKKLCQQREKQILILHQLTFDIKSYSFHS